MPVMKYAAGIVAAAVLAAQPCAAADDFRDMRAPERRSGAFAGLSINVPLDRGIRRRPTARLQLTTTSTVRRADGATITYRAPGDELGAGRRGRPTYSIAGQNPAEMRERLGVGGSTGTTLLIVGGVVLVVLVLATVASAMPQAGPDAGAFD